ncbi:MAG: hypothetical protein LPJ91_11090 [Pseudazoarcus pumilus]|nr:hypothetical protein [Pseudazoarcus pumilus]
MSDQLNEAETRFMERIDRRVDFLKTLLTAELAIYLPPDEQQRKRAIELMVRMTARQKELPYIRPETLQKATNLLSSHVEAMQKILPNDVQYRNRVRKHW